MNGSPVIYEESIVSKLFRKSLTCPSKFLNNLEKFQGTRMCQHNLKNTSSNSHSDQLQVGFIATLEEHCTCRSHGFKSQSSLNLFQDFLSLTTA